MPDSYICLSFDGVAPCSGGERYLFLLVGHLLFSKGCILCFIQLTEPDMPNPCAKSRLKRKRAEKQSQKLSIGKDLDKDVKKEETTPFISSPKKVISPAVFILDQASLKKGLVKKVFCIAG